MSKNFELLTRLEAEYAEDTHPGTISAAAQSVRITDSPAPHIDLLTEVSPSLLKLAQSITANSSPGAQHVISIVGVDSRSASSKITAALGRILASFSSGPVCIVNARPGNKSEESANDLGHECESLNGPNVRTVGRAALGMIAGGLLPPSGLLRSYIDDMRGTYEYILIDAPAVNAGAEGPALSKAADATILVVEANVTRKKAAEKAIEALEAAKAHLLGVVLNNRTFAIPESIYRWF